MESALSVLGGLVQRFKTANAFHRAPREKKSLERVAASCTGDGTSSKAENAFHEAGSSEMK
jgi:hypothetical protein